jgi:hypothetical protein
MKKAPKTLLSLTLLATAALSTSVLAGPPGMSEFNGQKVLTLISRDPPGVRCNNNIQVAAELQNLYKIPFVVIPVSQAGPGAKAPAIYYGDDLIAVDGGNLNGMLDLTTVVDVLELEGAPAQDQRGRLAEIQTEFDRFKQAIKTVQ